MRRWVSERVSGPGVITLKQMTYKAHKNVPQSSAHTWNVLNDISLRRWWWSRRRRRNGSSSSGEITRANIFPHGVFPERAPTSDREKKAPTVPSDERRIGVISNFPKVVHRTIDIANALASGVKRVLPLSSFLFTRPSAICFSCFCAITNESREDIFSARPSPVGIIKYLGSDNSC